MWNTAWCTGTSLYSQEGRTERRLSGDSRFTNEVRCDSREILEQRSTPLDYKQQAVADVWFSQFCQIFHLRPSVLLPACVFAGIFPKIFTSCLGCRTEDKARAAQGFRNPCHLHKATTQGYMTHDEVHLAANALMVVTVHRCSYGSQPLTRTWLAPFHLPCRFGSLDRGIRLCFEEVDFI
jgi:hypothetical protein